MLTPSDTRDRLTADLYLGLDDDAVAVVEQAFVLVIEADPLMRKLKDGAARETLSVAEQELLTRMEGAVAKAITVDDFAADAFGRS